MLIINNIQSEYEHSLVVLLELVYDRRKNLSLSYHDFVWCWKSFLFL